MVSRNNKATLVLVWFVSKYVYSGLNCIEMKCIICSVFFGGKCSLNLHSLPGTIWFEPNCRMRSIFMDSINRRRRKTNLRKNIQQILCAVFPFWIIWFELTTIVNSKKIIQKRKMEHKILKSPQSAWCYSIWAKLQNAIDIHGFHKQEKKENKS